MSTTKTIIGISPPPIEWPGDKPPRVRRRSAAAKTQIGLGRPASAAQPVMLAANKHDTLLGTGPGHIASASGYQQIYQKLYEERTEARAREEGARDAEERRYEAAADGRVDTVHRDEGHRDEAHSGRALPHAERLDAVRGVIVPDMPMSISPKWALAAIVLWLVVMAILVLTA